MMLSSTISSRKINIHELLASYRQTYGCEIRIEDAGSSSVVDLINNLIQLTEVSKIVENLYNIAN